MERRTRLSKDSSEAAECAGNELRPAAAPRAPAGRPPARLLPI